jgi:UDP-4-amino-4,6-dideoxy-N-acetyl-beta-L-altrosamine transaminase
MIPYGKHHIDEEDVQAVVNVLRSGTLTQGPAVENFEQTIATYVGAKYAVAVSSGTAALHLAALVAGVGPGKTLITSAITFVASANAGLYAGGDVAFADIDPDTINMSPLALKLALEKHPSTKAVVPVHFAGLPCEMPAIRTLADAAGAIIIEDAAHALGAIYSDGRRVGCCAYSAMTVFSFHPVKSIAAGEGGMITTNDESIFRKLLRLRSHGVNKLDDPFQLPEQAGEARGTYPWYYEMQDLGFHYRITDIQSSLATSQMKKLDSFLEHRKALVDRYDRAFANSKLVRPAQSVNKTGSGNHIYPVRIDFAAIGKTRRQVMLELRERDIGSQVHYIPVPMHPFYQRMGHFPGCYPDAMGYYCEALTLPLFFDLSFEQQNFVIATLQEVLHA